MAGSDVADIGEEENLREEGAGLKKGGAVRVSAAKKGLRGKGAPGKESGIVGTGGGGGD
jgi:hypothetical protein